MSVILGQSAAAAVDDPRGHAGTGFFQRVRHFIVHALDEMSFPKG
jgi:hypothetical protein